MSVFFLYMSCVYTCRAQLFFSVHASYRSPDIACRLCGQETLEELPARLMPLFYSFYGVKATVISKKCTQCGEIHHFDDPLSHTFNYKNSMLFHHELFNRYTILSTSGKQTFYHFINGVVADYANNNSKVDFVCQNTFESAYFQFDECQKWSNSVGCEKCDPERSGKVGTLMGDALHLSMPQRKAVGLRPPIEKDQTLKIKMTVERERFIYPLKSRKLFLKWTRKYLGKFQHAKVESALV